MEKHKYSVIIILLVLLGRVNPGFGQVYQGNYLYAPNNSKYTYLRDVSNNLIHSWTHTVNGGYSVYMSTDGSIWRSAVSGTSFNGGGATGMVQHVSWSGTVLWSYTYSSSTFRSHHDICPMPNGNVLLIAWESKTAAECVAAGLNHSSSLWPDHIVEVQPVGTTGGLIVWQWHFWDHLIQDYDPTKSNYGVVASHPELFDINVGSSASGDWMHCNSINYNSSRNEILICSHNLDELYIIDHSTTTTEAAGHTGGARGHGGDLLYRWGRASNYRVNSSAQVFDVVHCAVWIPTGCPGAGDIMAFNNREMQSTSMVVQITPPIDTSGNYIYTSGNAYLPTSPTWSYTASGFYSNHLGGNQRLPNGNTIIAESTSGYLFEVNSAGTVQWSYSPGGEIVRVLKYPLDYIIDVKITGSVTPSDYELMQNYPNPFNMSTSIKYSIPKSTMVSVKIYDMTGKEIATLVNNCKQNAGTYSLNWNGTTDNGRIVTSGVYFCRLITPDVTKVQKLVVVK